MPDAHTASGLGSCLGAQLWVQDKEGSPGVGTPAPTCSTLFLESCPDSNQRIACVASLNLDITLVSPLKGDMPLCLQRRVERSQSSTSYPASKHDPFLSGLKLRLKTSQLLWDKLSPALDDYFLQRNWCF